jgi:hypothetical protein
MVNFKVLTIALLGIYIFIEVTMLLNLFVKTGQQLLDVCIFMFKYATSKMSLTNLYLILSSHNINVHNIFMTEAMVLT